jgi:hypothetical protein
VKDVAAEKLRKHGQRAPSLVSDSKLEYPTNHSNAWIGLSRQSNSRKEEEKKFIYFKSIT